MARCLVRDPLKIKFQKVGKKCSWQFQIFEHLPSESPVHFEREIDLIGKLTCHMYIFVEKIPEGTYLIFGGFRRYKQKA
jgi:hypothetical protein